MKILFLEKLHTNEFDENWIIADRSVALIYSKKKGFHSLH